MLTLQIPQTTKNVTSFATNTMTSPNCSSSNQPTERSLSSSRCLVQHPLYEAVPHALLQHRPMINLSLVPINCIPGYISGIKHGAELLCCMQLQSGTIILGTSLHGYISGIKHGAELLCCMQLQSGTIILGTSLHGYISGIKHGAELLCCMQLQSGTIILRTSLHLSANQHLSAIHSELVIF